MNVGVAAIAALAVLFLGYRFYSRFVARAVGIDPSRPTPATQVNDGVDFVPTKPLVLFGHHYASIAGAGPIVGPTLALLYGFGPGLLWIVLGVVLIGAVHDFTALFITMREGGRSVAEVARRTFGKPGFLFFAAFAFILCVLVSASFLDLTATALTSRYPLQRLGLLPDQTLLDAQPGAAQLQRISPERFEELRTAALAAGVPAAAMARVEEVALAYREGRPDAADLAATLDRDAAADADVRHAMYHVDAVLGRVGGIASTSVVVITLAAPLIGFLLYRKRLGLHVVTPLALLVCAVSVIAGFALPVTLEPRIWAYLVLGYCVIGGWVAVWLVLQPRDFINVHILYLALAAIVLGLAACGLKGVTIDAPMENLAEGQANPKLGLLWPFLFVTIACGSVSGAHGLICGGTTCKQISSEGHARAVGYGGMLLEAVLGICVVLAVSTLSYEHDYKVVVWREGNTPLGFALGVANVLHVGFGVPRYLGAVFGIVALEGFLVTTIDTVVRLSRYLLEESIKTVTGWEVKSTFFRLVTTLVVCALVAWITFTKGYLKVWTIFGSANQLLAALTLVVGTAWLMKNGRNFWVTLLPAIFMLATTIGALVLILKGNWDRDWMMVGVAGVLLLLAVGFAGMATRYFLRRPTQQSAS